MADWPCRGVVIMLTFLAASSGALADSTLPQETPRPLSRPSAQQQLDAMKERLNSLQRQVNYAKALGNYAADNSECITGGVWLAPNPETGAYEDAQPDTPEAVLAATLDATCATS